MKYLPNDYYKYAYDNKASYDGEPIYDDIWSMLSKINEDKAWKNFFWNQYVNSYYTTPDNYSKHLEYDALVSYTVKGITDIAYDLEKAATTHLAEENHLKAISCYNKIIVIDNTGNPFFDRVYIVKIYQHLSGVYKHCIDDLEEKVSLLKKENLGQEPVIAHAAEREDNLTGGYEVVAYLEGEVTTLLAKGDRLGAISYYNKIIEIVSTNYYPDANYPNTINYEYLIKIRECLSAVQLAHIYILEQEVRDLNQMESSKNEENSIYSLDRKSYINSLEQKIATLRQKEQEQAIETPVIAIATEEKDDDLSTISTSSQEKSLENEEQELVTQTPVITEEKLIHNEFSAKLSRATSSFKDYARLLTPVVSAETSQLFNDIITNTAIFIDKALNIEHPKIQYAIVNKPIKNTVKGAAKLEILFSPKLYEKLYNKEYNFHFHDKSTSIYTKVSLELKKLFPANLYKKEHLSHFYDKSISTLLEQYESAPIPAISSFTSLPKIPDFSYNRLTNTAIFLDKPLNIGPLSLYDTIRLLSFISKEVIEHSREINYFLTDKLHLDQLSIVKKSQEMIPDYLNDLSSNQYLITTVYFASCFISLTTLIPLNSHNFAFSSFISLSHHMSRNYKFNHLLHDFIDISIIKMAYPDIILDGAKTAQIIIVKNTLAEIILPSFKIEQQDDHTLSMISHITPYINIIDLVFFVSCFYVFKLDEKISHKSSLVEAMYVVKRVSVAFDLTIAFDNILKIALYEIAENFITPAINYFGFGSDDINVAGEIENMENTTEL